MQLHGLLWDIPGAGEKDKPEAGAIPCYTGKVLGAEPGGCCLEGTKALRRHLGFQQCRFQFSFLPTVEEQDFLLLSLRPEEGKGGKLLLGGCLGSTEVGMSWQFVCTSPYVELGAGLSLGGSGRLAEEAGDKLLSAPRDTLCVYRMFGFLLIPSRGGRHGETQRQALCFP